MAPSETPTRRDVPDAALPVFVILTFAITWSIAGFYIFLPDTATAWFGAISGAHPLFFLATWGPAISALIIVSVVGGRPALRAFASRLLLWRCPPVWVIFVALGLPLVFMAGSLIKGGPWLAPIPPVGAGSLIAMMFLMLLLGPIEELGWRGAAQPLLQRRVAPIWAGMIIGAIWGLWHLPAFYLSGSVQSGWSFTPFFIGNVVLAVLVTPIFNAARGSLLWPILFHWNLINPFWPDAQPYDTWILVAVTAGVVWLNRTTMFTRDGAITRVIPGPGG